MSNNGFPFKPSLFFYILKNASIKIQIKLLKCNRAIKESLKNIHGFCCDLLTVHHNEQSPFLAFEDDGQLEYVTEFRDHRLTSLNPIKVRDILTLYTLFDENIIELLPKINIQNIKTFDTSNVYISADTMTRVLNPGLINLRVAYSQIDGNFDVLNVILSSCPNLKVLFLPWQPEITNLVNCTKIERNTKFAELYLYNISEYIDPEIVVTFANKNVTRSTKLVLFFNFALPIGYIKNVDDLIISKNCIVEIMIEVR